MNLHNNLSGIAVALMLVCPCAAPAEQPLPKSVFPQRTAGLSDEDFARRFFAGIDLERRDMKPVRNHLDREEFAEALDAWREALIDRAASLPRGEYSTLRWHPFPLAQLMGEEVIFEGWALPPVSMGAPGELRWHDAARLRKSSDKPVDASQIGLMWPMRRLVVAIEFASGVYADTPRSAWPEPLQSENKDIRKPAYAPEAMLRRWGEIWNDFANNNWREAMELRADPGKRAQKLHEADMTPDDFDLRFDYGFGWRWMTESFPKVRKRVDGGNPVEGEWFPVAGGVLMSGWLCGNFAEQLHRAATANPEAFRAAVPARKLAETVDFMARWPVRHLADQVTVLGWPPNQIWTGNAALLHNALLFPEIKASNAWRNRSSRSIRLMLARAWQPDGSDSELSYNYNQTLAEHGHPILERFEGVDEVPDFIDDLRRAVLYRERFLESLHLPWGYGLGLGKNDPDFDALPEMSRRPSHAGSVYFPWHGLGIQRKGWGPDALAAALAGPRRGNGHESDDGNALVLEAFGRRILVSNSGAEPVGEGNYMASSWAENTIQVDGLGQNRFAVAKHGAYQEPVGYRWYHSAHFDFTESAYEYGYGRVLDPARPGLRLDNEARGAVVDDVIHRRELFFLRDAEVWILVDRLDAPADAEHTYTQTWNFSHLYPEDNVRLYPSMQLVKASDSDGPALFLCFAGQEGLVLRKHFMEDYVGPGGSGKPASLPLRGNETSRDSGVLHHFPVTARGWHNVGGGWAPLVYPAVDIHTEWRGTGDQKLVTLLVPARGDENPFADRPQRAHAGGVTRLECTLKNGLQIAFADADSASELELAGVSATARTLLVQIAPGEPVRGIALGAKRIAGEAPPASDFSFEYTPGLESIRFTPIDSPRSFRWEGSGAELRPAYQ
jgi:hypothetical protein